MSLKKYLIREKDYIWSPATCSCENRKYLASILDDSMITWNEIIEETVPTDFNDKSSLNTKFLTFTYLFINYNCIFDSCYYSLFSDKIQSKTKTFITISRHKQQLKEIICNGNINKK